MTETAAATTREQKLRDMLADEFTRYNRTWMHAEIRMHEIANPCRCPDGTDDDPACLCDTDAEECECEGSDLETLRTDAATYGALASAAALAMQAIATLIQAERHPAA